MTSVIRETKVFGSPREVWRVLAALDQYEEWESGYVSSVYLTDQQSGIGARRRVELKSPMGVRYAIHEVTKWEEERVIAWKAIESNFPFLAAAEQTVTLRKIDADTSVENRVDYELKYGVIGRVVDPLMFRRVVEGANQGFLDDLATSTLPKAD